MNTDKTYLIKPLCGWTNDVLNWIRRFAKDRKLCQSDNIRFIPFESEEKADYYIILNSTTQTGYIPEKTIVFYLEPFCHSYYQNWGIKTWSEWNTLIKTQSFLQVRTHDKYIPFLTWQLEKTIQELYEEKIEKTGVLSTIMSSKYFDPGHIVRIETLREIDKSDLNIHIYGYDNNLGFKKYKGSHKKDNKNEGILPYKYHIHCENNKEKNFITEKIWEALLSECVLFYWGCPNVHEYVDPRCLILLGSADYNYNLTIIKNAINNNEWENRIDVIRQEKKRILTEYSLFTTMKQIIKSVENKPIDIWIHCCNKNNGVEIIRQQIIRIKRSSLYNRIRNIYIGVIGADVPDKNISPFDDHKIKMLHISPFVTDSEYVTVLCFLKQYLDQNSLILYIHSKGITRLGNTCVSDWKEMMEYFLIDNWEKAESLLEKYDIVGCNLSKSPTTHFSGNFWFANGNYLFKNKERLGRFFYKFDINLGKHVQCSHADVRSFPAVEFWAASHPEAKTYSLHNSKINHYIENYPKEKYIYN